jgi:hypothetical protein
MHADVPDTSFIKKKKNEPLIGLVLFIMTAILFGNF